MIETCFFTCPQKGKMLSVIFDEGDIIDHNFLSQFKDNPEIDAYVELLYRKDGKQFTALLHKHELTNQAIVKEMVDWLVFKINPEFKIK